MSASGTAHTKTSFEKSDHVKKFQWLLRLKLILQDQRPSEIDLSIKKTQDALRGKLLEPDVRMSIILTC